MRTADDAEIRFERVLVVGAHPDDAEFSAGGTLARMADAGTRITLVVCTDGRRGGRELRDVAEIRRAEQAAAAKVIGVEELVHLDRPDGELECDDELRADVVRAIRRARPELVLTHDPRTLWREFRTRAFLGHTDHRAAGQATLDAIYPRSANPNFFPDQLREPGVELWFPQCLWLFDTDEPELRVDVTDTFERKLEALRLHESQEAAGGGLLAAARGVAARVGTPDRPAESFKPLRLR